MKRYIFIVIALTSLFFVCTAYSEESNIEMKRYYFLDSKLSMEIPIAWTIKIAKDKYGVFDAHDTSELRHIIVSDEYFDYEVNLDRQFQKFLEVMGTVEVNFKLIKTGNAIISNHPAKWVIHKKDYDEKHMQSINYIVLVGNHEYIIGGTSLADKFDKNRPLFEKIIKSSLIEK